jgi:hypothetical protein
MTAAEVIEKKAISEFRPGLYRHYKGGYYTAICLVRHHEKRYMMVLYVSHTYGGLNARPLVGYPGDYDGWNDIVEVNGVEYQRFAFIGELPSKETMANRERLMVGSR